MYVQTNSQSCISFSKMDATSPVLGIQAHDATPDLFTWDGSQVLILAGWQAPYWLSLLTSLLPLYLSMLQ